MIHLSLTFALTVIRHRAYTQRVSRYRAKSISSDCISFYTQLRGRCRVEEGRSEQRIPWKRNGLDDSSSLLLFTRARSTYVLETGWIIFTSRYASTIERSMIKVKFGRSLSFPLKFFSFQFAGGKIGYGSVSFASDNARNRNPGFGEKKGIRAHERWFRNHLPILRHLWESWQHRVTSFLFFRATRGIRCTRRCCEIESEETVSFLV